MFKTALRPARGTDAATRGVVKEAPMKRTLIAIAWLAAGAIAAAQTQGVSKTEITLGTIQDLSGPIAAHGKQIRWGMPVQFEHNVINFLPVAPAREMYEPAHRLKYAILVSNFDLMRHALPKLIADKHAQKVCTIYQDDEFGLDALRGVEAALAGLNMRLAETTSYKRSATDFSWQVARMKAAGCDLVALGTVIRETVGVIGEGRKTGFDPTYLTTVAAYHDLVPKLGGAPMNGLYATMAWRYPYLDDESDAIRAWAATFKTRFGEAPAGGAGLGYAVMDTFVRAATKAGPELSTDSLIRAIDTLSVPPDIFGGPALSWSPTKRLGSDASRLSQLVDGRWKVVSDYLTAPQAAKP
jgi:branched-chain amino acid transport system substrate-binding protein